MQIVTTYFDVNTDDRYGTLYRVLERSVNKNSDGAKFRGVKLRMSDEHYHPIKACGYNTLKLKEWVMQSKCGGNVCLVDCDMMLLKSISCIFQLDFDVAFTKRSYGCRLPINCGVVFVKPTDRAYAFMDMWYESNMKLFKDQKLHKPWREKYGGMNQASLGYVLENCNYSANVILIPCKDWNSCDDDWENMDCDTRLIHVKGKLRRACFGDIPVEDSFRGAYNKWIEIKNEL